MRIAYADPPYPGMAHLYPENTEVDHVALLVQLSEYDGWALSTDERSLAYVLSLCPAGVRICAWCRSNTPPFLPNPYAAWEPVIVNPARIKPVTTRAYYVSGVPNGKHQRDGLTGQKTSGFCEWVIRCLGADAGDDLDDLFPGTGVMGETWRTFQHQRPLFAVDVRGRGHQAKENILRREHPALDGIDKGEYVKERRA
jgi:hypothetical protein